MTLLGLRGASPVLAGAWLMALALLVAAPSALAQADDVAAPELGDGSDVVDEFDPEALGGDAEPDAADLEALITEIAGPEGADEGDAAAPPESAPPAPAGAPSDAAETPGPGAVLAGLGLAGAAALVGRRR